MKRIVFKSHRHHHRQQQFHRYLLNITTLKPLNLFKRKPGNGKATSPSRFQSNRTIK